MKYIKSRITWYSIFVSIFMLIIPFPATLVWIFKILMNFTFCVKNILSLIISVSLLSLIRYFFKDVKYIIIKNDGLTYYSLLQILGKTLNFRDYIGKIITTETGSAGSYEVVYLVDGQNRTAFKLMGIHYKNFEEINDAIPLKKIRFSPTIGQYFKLLFTGKIKVKKEENKDDERKNKNAKQTISKIIFIVVTIGLSLSVIGVIIKILSKIR